MRSIPSGSARVAVEVSDLRLAVAACAPSTSFHSDISTNENLLDFPRGTIEFEQASEPATRQEFATDLRRDLARLELWAASQQWTPPPILKFRVIISNRFKISRSLVPAWSGQQGHMEFPAWRVVARNAAIAHELVHVFFPNGNRLLAEGLAVYLQADLGGNPAFPNFSRPLHELAAERLCSMAGDPPRLDAISLAELDAIPTPSPLTLRVDDDFYGEEPRGQSHLYPIAGSFVQHLIETHGLTQFRALYERTPLLPRVQHAGTPERWNQIYGRSLSELERPWKAMIASMTN